MVSKEMLDLINDGVSLSEEKHLYVKNLSEISSKIPKDILRKNEKFIETYFRAQIRIAKGQVKKAGRILNGLDKKAGFLDFEKKNERLLTAIDYAVKGSTNRRDERRNPIEPLFRLEK